MFLHVASHLVTVSAFENTVLTSLCDSCQVLLYIPPQIIRHINMSICMWLESHEENIYMLQVIIEIP